MKNLMLFAILTLGLIGSIGAVEDQSKFTLTSSNFQNNGPIPTSFACTPRGQNLSPDISWSNPPIGTQSFVLTVIDPDAPGGNFVHWLVYNIPSTDMRLPQGFPKEEKNSKGIMQGLNNHNHVGYDGPCPPSGTHRYVFTLYALNTTLSLSPGIRLNELSKAIKGHVIGQAVLVGTFAHN